MAQTGVVVNQNRRNRQEMAQQVAEAQATQEAIAHATVGGHQEIGTALCHIGQQAVANTQLTATVGVRPQDNQDDPSRMITQALREPAAKPNSITNSHTSTNALNQLGIANVSLGHAGCCCASCQR